MEFDLTTLLPYSPLLGLTLVVILGVTQFIKTKLGIGGRAAEILGFTVGLLLGGGLMVSIYGYPAEFAGWFQLVLIGLAFGLVAVGIFKMGRDLASSGFIALLDGLDEEEAAE